MAEERLIDDNTDRDKDKKYRFRINEDGEEELEIAEDEQPQEDETDEALYDTGMEVPEFTSDDEEAATMTPEQLFLARKKEEEEQEESVKKAAELIAKARALADEGQTEYALITLDSAQKERHDSADIYPLKLSLLTDGYKNFGHLEECVSVAEKLAKYSSEADRAQISAVFGPQILTEQERVEEENKRLRAENEQKKEERRQRFSGQRRRAVRNLLFAVVPFIGLLIAACVLSGTMYSDESGTLFVVTIVLFGLAGVALIASVLLCRPLARAVRRIRLNKSDSSTALGRECTAGEERATLLRRLYSYIYYVNTITSVDAKGEVETDITEAPVSDKD